MRSFAWRLQFPIRRVPDFRLSSSGGPAYRFAP